MRAHTDASGRTNDRVTRAHLEDLSARAACYGRAMKSAIGNGGGIALGISLGVALGVALDNIGLGIALGIALGAALDTTQRRRDSGDE